MGERRMIPGGYSNLFFNRGLRDSGGGLGVARFRVFASRQARAFVFIPLGPDF